MRRAAAFLALGLAIGTVTSAAAVTTRLGTRTYVPMQVGDSVYATCRDGVLYTPGWANGTTSRLLYCNRKP